MEEQKNMGTGRPGFPPPVTFEQQYQVFKMVEASLKDRLSTLDHEYNIIGMRIAYDSKDSPNEPDVLPYKVEFGKLDIVDQADKSEEEISEEELTLIFKDSPITLEALDSFYDLALESLEKEAGSVLLRVVVDIVLTGSGPYVYRVACTCSAGTRKKYIVKLDGRVIKSYCTTRSC